MQAEGDTRVASLAAPAVVEAEMIEAMGLNFTPAGTSLKGLRISAPRFTVERGPDGVIAGFPVPAPEDTGATPDGPAAAPPDVLI